MPQLGQVAANVRGEFAWQLVGQEALLLLADPERLLDVVGPVTEKKKFPNDAKTQ